MINVTKRQAEVAAKMVSVAKGTRTTLPVLSTIKVEVKDGLLNMTATDLSVAVFYREETDADDVSFCVSAVDYARVVKAGSKVELTSNNLNIKTGASKFRLPVISPDEFPDISVSNGVSINIKTDAIRAPLSSLASIIPDNATNPKTSGVSLFAKNGKLSMYSCTPIGEIVAKIEFDVDFNGEFKCILTKQTISALQFLTGEYTNVCFREGNITFSSGDVTVYGNLIGEDALDLSQYIKLSGGDRYIVVVHDMLSALKMVKPFAPDLLGYIMTVIPESDGLELVAVSDKGSGNGFVACEVHGDTEFAVSCEYLQKAFNAVDEMMTGEYATMVYQLEPRQAIYISCGDFVCAVGPMKMK